MTIGVVTVTFNASAFLRRFLECCLAQESIAFELLVIDNASSDDSADLAQSLDDPRVLVLRNASNLGYAAACNQAILHFASREVGQLLFINNDTEFGSHLFFSMSHHMVQHDADAVTPRITYFEDVSRNWYSGGRFIFWKGFQGTHSMPRKRLASDRALPSWVEVAPGCCVLFHMRTFKRVGLFDPAYFVYSEDTDMFVRMRKFGLRLLYVPGISLAHKVSSSTGGPQSDFSIRYHQRNQIYAIRKHFSRWTVVTQVILLGVKICVRRSLGWDDGRQFRMRWRALREGWNLELPDRELSLSSPPSPVSATGPPTDR